MVPVQDGAGRLEKEVLMRPWKLLTLALCWPLCISPHAARAEDPPPLAPLAEASGEVLPFAPTPSASSAGLTMKDSRHQKRVEPRRLAVGAPNILILLMDDVGPGTPSTYGSEVNTPTLDRVARANAAGGDRRIPARERQLRRGRDRSLQPRAGAAARRHRGSRRRRPSWRRGRYRRQRAIAG